MILCIDTCTEHAGVALVQKTKAVYKPLPKGRYAESLLAVIDKVFKAAKAKSVDLTGVLVIKGPGSFTSLRVGIAVANQFAHQLKIPILGLRTDEWWLRRLPAGAGTDERPVMYLQSMNREEVYTITSPDVILSLSCVIPSNVEGSTTITPITQLALDPSTTLCSARDDIRYLGQLTSEHKANLPLNFKAVRRLRSPEQTWLAVAQSIRWPRRQKTYALIEPFYGKEPTITKSKKNLLSQLA